MESETGRKLFLGHLNYSTNEDVLENYFGRYGKLDDCVVMRYPDTKKSRGFGFVTYATRDQAESCYNDGPHTLQEAKLDMKWATPRDEASKKNSKEVRGKESSGEAQRKLFVGGLSYATTEEGLRNHFEEFGELDDVIVMKYKDTGRSRGFGFIVFKDKSSVDAVQQARPHKVEGTKVETRRAVPRDANEKLDSHQNIKKIFIGGLKEGIEDKDLEDYFGEFGNIVNLEQMIEKGSGKKRGFGFIEFDDYDAVDKIIIQQNHYLGDWRLDIKKALSRAEMELSRNSGDRGGVRPAPWARGSSGGTRGFSGENQGFGGRKQGFSGENQGFSGGNQGFGGGNQGFSGGNQGFSGENQGFNNGNQGFNGGNQGFSGGNQGFSNGSQGFNGGNQGFSGGNQGFNGGNQGFNGGNQGFSGGNQGLSGGNQGFRSGNQGFNGGNQGFSGGNQGFRGGNQGFNGGNQGFSGGNQGFSGGNQGFSGGNQGFSGGNQGLIGGNQGFRSGNQGFNGRNQGFSGGNQGSRAGNQGFNGGNQGFSGGNQGFSGGNQGFSNNPDYGSRSGGNNDKSPWESQGGSSNSGSDHGSRNPGPMRNNSFGGNRSVPYSMDNRGGGGFFSRR